MATNKDCRNAKTAEEYLLQCLFKAKENSIKWRKRYLSLYC